MNKRLLFSCLGWMAVAGCLSAQTLTQTLYFDFGKSDATNGNTTVGADANGHYWNNIVSDESGSPSTKPAGYRVELVNGANEPTGFVFETTEAFRANGRKNGGLLSPSAEHLGDLAVATTTEDYFFIESGQNDKGAFLLQNLDPGKAYKFYVFGSRQGTDNRTAVYSIGGLNGSHGTLTATGTNGQPTNDRHVFESGYVVPRANGEILFEVGILSGGFAYINAMKVEEYEGWTLPEAVKKCYIDFGKNNGGLDGQLTQSPDANGNYWNNMYSNGDGPTQEQAGTKIALIYSDNTMSPYSVELGTMFEFNGVRNGGLTDPDPALLGDLAVATATHDYLFRSGDGVKCTLLFKNLDKNKMYRFHVFGSRYEENGNRIGLLTFTGSNTLTGLHQMGGKDLGGTGVHWNTENIFVSDLLVPDTEGTITLDMKEWNGNFVHINALKLEEMAIADYATALSVERADVTVCGEVRQMTAKSTPEGAFCPAVVWSVDSEEVAQITASGKLYPKHDGTVTVTATATFPDGTSLSASKQLTVANQHTGDHSLTVMGSSVPYGQGADTGKGYAQLLAAYLAQDAQNAWSTDNVSVPGNNTTDVLNRWDNDLLPTCSRYVYYGLSLGNEGVHENGQVAFNSWRDNMLLLIDKTRGLDKVPVIGNNYARADFNASDYNYVKQLNLLIHEWDVPSVNLLGAIDNGNGQWATGYQQDNAHPNTAGHAEMFYAFVPSLFDALAAGKPRPERLESEGMLFANDPQVNVLEWTPENVLHPFTLTFSFRTAEAGGTLAAFDLDGGVRARLTLDSDGHVAYGTLKSSAALNDNQWHTVSLTHYHAWGRTFLYVDGVRQSGEVQERLAPVAFRLCSEDDVLKQVSLRELYFHRAGMTAEEIKALHQGRLLQSSLEIYAPLDGSASADAAVENRAQSLNVLTLSLRDADETLLPSVSVATVREVTVYTLTGSRLMSLPGSEWEARRHELPAGLYVLGLTDTDGQTVTRKMVVE